MGGGNWDWQLMSTGSFKKKNVLKLESVEQPCEYTKKQWMVYFKWWLVWYVNSHLNKVAKKLW